MIDTETTHGHVRALGRSPPSSPRSVKFPRAKGGRNIDVRDAPSPAGENQAREPSGPADPVFWAATGGFASPPAAINAKRASAGRDFDPVRFMILMRWFSTVRWLMPRSAAIFLLGWPASTISITCTWRGVRPSRRPAAEARHSNTL